MEEAQKLQMTLTIGVNSGFLNRLRQQWTGGAPQISLHSRSAGGSRLDLARAATRPLLRRAPNGNLPSKQEKAVTAKRAPVGLKKPLENHLDRVSGAYASKIDGSAMGAARRE